MTLLTLARRGLGFYRRTHLGVLAGCALSSAVLSGALFVGDSVRESLTGIALARVGGADVALDAGNRLFRDDLARRVGPGARTALHVPGMALREGSDPRQVNRVEVYGVDGTFLEPTPAPGPGKVLLSAKLAEALGVRAGEEIALRMFKPGLLSRDAPLASRKERETRRKTFTVEAVLSDRENGRFSLKSDQAAPANAFVQLRDLQEALELEGRANILTARGTADAVEGALRKGWTLGDLGLVVRNVGGIVQLQSARIYLDPEVARAAMAVRPGAVGAHSYLVDSLASGGKSTPYFFMTALSPSGDRRLGPVPADMKDDEILVNRWMADRLSLKTGDEVDLAFSEFTPQNKFLKRHRSFRVRGILEMAEVARERELVPEFPGLTDVDSCKDWKDVGGDEMDEEKLKDPANEEYWKTFKQTPKAFVTLRTGREMWSNRYGDLMAVRFPPEALQGLEGALRDAIDPTKTGLVVRPVRDEALRSASQSMDLGGLFLGMSMFLIAASLILTAMLFVFSVEQRAREMGVLRTVGFAPGKVRAVFLIEGAILAVLGAVAGIPLGWAFCRGLLAGLSGASLRGAVAGAAVELHATGASAALGAGLAAGLSLAAMALTLRRQAGRPIRELVSDDFSLSLETRSAGKGRLRWFVFGAGLAGAAAIAGGTVVSRAENPAEGFFGAGALLLAAGLALVRILLGRMSERPSARLSVAGLGARNVSRRPGRGMATVGMIACGCFIVFSVSAFKEDLTLKAGARRSGTGGFALYGETSVVLHDDLNGVRARKAFRLSEEALLNGVSVVPLRVREGDDASCLNLNQSLEPPLVGVDADRLGRLGAFAPADLWKLLEEPGKDGAIPVLVGDSATAVWKLRKSVGRDAGDVIEYRDERGEPFKVRLVGALPERLTILQGRLLISNRHFTRLYPSEGGDKIVLVDVPVGKEDRVRSYLQEHLEGVGLDLVRSVDRLKDFYAVESAYLTMFLALGGLGLLLGSAGMGILVLRQVLERRSELALLRAVGYSRGDTERVVLAEHRFLLVAGLLAGTAASAMAILPAVARPEIHLPYGVLLALLGGTGALSIAWIRLAARAALRSPLLEALRSE